MPEKKTKDELIRILQGIAKEIGGSPKISDLEEFDSPHPSTFQRRFGSWNAAIRAAGLQPGKRKNIGKEELREELVRLSQEVGHPPTKKEMEEQGEFSPRTYVRTFGGWLDAREAAGLESDLVQPNKRASSGELLAALTELSNELQHPPTAAEMTKLGDYSHFTYQERFGSWNEALERAGLEPNVDRTAYTVPCKQCGTELERNRHQVETVENPFCSQECRSEWLSENWSGEDSPTWKGGKVEVTCDTCESTIERWPAKTKGFDYQFCDPECRGEWIQENKSGEDNPNWKGGYEPYYGSNWTKQREKALNRDNNTCQGCGMGGEEHEREFETELHIHHIRPLREFENVEAANSLSNLVTLCAKCHKKWEGLPVAPEIVQ